MQSKRCSKCAKIKPLEEFNRNRTKSGGRETYCIFCHRERLKVARDANRLKNTPAITLKPLTIDPEGFLKDVAATVAPPIQVVDTREALQIARLKAELQSAREQARAMEKLALTGESLREIIGTLHAPNIVANPEWMQGANKQRSNTGTPVLQISDIHWDEVVRSEQVGGCNEYNREIATKRLRNTFRAAVRLLKGHMSRPNYDGIVCPLGGDIFSGNIHEELVETNEVPIQVSMLAIEPILIEGLGALADEFGKVHVPCVTGNHGRMHKKPRAKNRAFENFEWSVYQRLAAYFKTDARLTFDIPEGSDAHFQVYKKRFLLTHGDQFKGGGGIGGILVPILRGLSKKQVREQAIGGGFDTMLIGHFHQLTQLESLIINGSLKGYDEYAYQNNFGYEPAQQALFVVHPELGITARWPVRSDYESGQGN